MAIWQDAKGWGTHGVVREVKRARSRKTARSWGTCAALSMTNLKAIRQTETLRSFPAFPACEFKFYFLCAVLGSLPCPLPALRAFMGIQSEACSDPKYCSLNST